MADRSSVVDSSLLVAMLSATLYVVGYLHWEARRVALGVALPASVPSLGAMAMESFVVLLQPLGLVVLAGLCVTILTRSSSRGPRWASIGALSSARVVGLVVTAWVLDLMGDILHWPGGQQVWATWTLRSIVLGSVAAGALLAEAIRWRMGRRWPFSPRTSAAAGWYAWLTLLALAGAALGNRLDWWLWCLLAIGWGTVLLKAWRERGPNWPTPRPTVDATFGLWAAWSVLALLLGAGFHGAAEGRAIAQGCVARPGVMFDPVPPGLPSNRTLWLVDQDDGLYHVRVVDGNASDGVDYLVPKSTPSIVAITPIQASC